MKLSRGIFLLTILLFTGCDEKDVAKHYIQDKERYSEREIRKRVEWYKTTIK